MLRTKATNIDAYIADFPEDVQEVLEKIRSAIKKAAPGVEEIISYAIPAFKLDGHHLIYFAGYKNHVSIYPAPRGKEAFTTLLADYKGGKGTVQFPLDKPIPLSLITKIVKFRMQENAEKAKGKKK